MIFNEPPKIKDLTTCVCHTGGAIGSDTYWEEMTEKYGGTVKAYSYKTNSHVTKNKVELSDSEYEEGLKHAKSASKLLGRTFNNRYSNLLARNWFQVKNSYVIYAIGHIINPGEKNSKGFVNKSTHQVVDGGTGYAVMMGIQNNKSVLVFDQNKDKWYRWSYITNKFTPVDTDVFLTTKKFAGIGTRDLKDNGKRAIEKIFKLTKED